MFLFVSNSFSQWVQVGNGLNGTVMALTVQTGGLEDRIWAGGSFASSGSVFLGKVAYSYGGSWFATDTIDNFNNSVHTLYHTNNYLFAGGHFDKFIKKFIGVGQWVNLGSAYLDGDVNAITSIGNEIYAAGSFSFAGTTPLHYVGRWNGSNWFPLDTGLNATASALAVIGNNLYVGGSFYKTYAGMDLKRIGMWNGHWNQLGTGIPNGWVNSLAVSGSDLYVAGSFSLPVSNGVAHNIAKWDGSSWSIVGSPQTPGLNDEITSLTVSGGTVYAGGYFTATHGGTVTLNRIAKWDGTNWQSIGSGFNAPVKSLCIAGNYLYAGGDFITSGTTSVLHVAKWSTPIGIQQIGNEVPAGYSLSQNYPNPFNPTTKISIEIPVASNVIMEVFDLKGQKISELINKELKAGKYEVDWDASNCSSGTYFYRVKAGSYIETKKMVLVK